MPSIKTEIVINAPKERIWQVLTDFESYGDWNPLIPKIICQGSLGTKVTIHLKNKGLTIPINAKVSDYAINRKFAWSGPELKAAHSVIKAKHSFEIIEIEKGTCLFKHEETFDGFLPRLLWLGISKLEASYSEMNTALKEKAESF